MKEMGFDRVSAPVGLLRVTGSSIGVRDSAQDTFPIILISNHFDECVERVACRARVFS